MQVSVLGRAVAHKGLFENFAMEVEYSPAACAPAHQPASHAAVPAHVRCASAKAAGVSSKVTAILGAQWGDEGKGKLADVLAKK